MNKNVSTAIIAATVAIIAGGVTMAVTHPPSGGQVAEAAEAAVAAPVAVVEPVRPVEPPKPVAAPARDPVYEDADAAGVRIPADYDGDRRAMLNIATFSKARTKQGVLALLNDPASAQFRNVAFSQMAGTNGVVFCGEVNARNTIGGYGDFRYFYGLGRNVEIDDGSSLFARNFQTFCLNSPPIGIVHPF